MRIKFVDDFTKRGIIKPEYRETGSMPSDILTKALAAPRLDELRQVIGLDKNRLNADDDRTNIKCYVKDSVDEEECWKASFKMMIH